MAFLNLLRQAEHRRVALPGEHMLHSRKRADLDPYRPAWHFAYDGCGTLVDSSDVAAHL